METISTKELFKNAFLAAIKPREKFREINCLGMIAYKNTIILMFIVGAISSIISFFFLFQQNLLMVRSFFPVPGLALIEETIFLRFGLWIGGTIFFYFLSRAFGKNVQVKKIEIGVFYLWFIFILMPIFDFFHLWIPIKYLEKICLPGKVMYLHYSYIFALIVGSYETFFFLTEVLKFENFKEKIFAFLIAPFSFFLSRTAEEIPRFFYPIFKTLLTIEILYYIFIFLMILLCFFFWRFIHKKEKIIYKKNGYNSHKKIN